MFLLEKIGNKVRAAVQFWGPPPAKRSLWNKEYATGRWNYIDHTPEDCIYQFIVKYSRRGAILDLGCGAGNTGTELAPETYSAYLGVDISDVATEKAAERAHAAGRVGNSYAQGDIESFVPSSHFDVILFRESIFYVPLSKIPETLRRYSRYLKNEGVFIVRLCDGVRYSSIIDLIKNNFRVLEHYSPPTTKTVVIVFAS
jgi:SAM-dependent methyltransferase